MMQKVIVYTDTSTFSFTSNKIVHVVDEEQNLKLTMHDRVGVVGEAFYVYGSWKHYEWAE